MRNFAVIPKWETKSAFWSKGTFWIDFCGVALGKGKSEAITRNLTHVMLFDDKLKDIFIDD